MKALKNRQFARWAKGERLTDRALCVAIREIERGLVDARLGGFLLKKRISKDYKGKSGGLRTIIAYRQEHRLVFLFGFAKRDRDNIDQTEKQALLDLGNVYMAMSEKDLSEAIRAGWPGRRRADF
ncbi:MAG: type II toxin-antitoxin system RelE/ParE family toxin [Rhodospirillaceae bacterium]|nr:type II toxin-antitoxin system RelE/ParE family toxin [Rhodospirillaceae bacterium]